MSHNKIDKKAITKIQTTVLVLIIVVASVAGVVYYYTTLNSGVAASSLTIVDYAGRTVIINGTIASVASNYPIATEVILFLGGEDKLIGADSTCMGNSFFTTLYPKLLNATNLGHTRTGTNIEQVVDLAPSVFVAGGGSVETADQLTALGVPTVCLSYETPEDFNYALTVLGKLLGDEATAESTVQYYTEKKQTIASKTQDLDDANKPSVLFIEYGAGKKYTLVAPGQGMIQNYLIEMAGGISVSANEAATSEISMEQVAVWDPDMIIVTSYASNVSTTDLKNQIMADDKWNITTAKVEGKVYAFAQDWGSWDAPTPKWILGACWLGKFIQPDLFASMDLIQLATDFYQRFYGITYEEATVRGDMK